MTRDTLAFVVLLDKPEDATIRDVQDYIEDAVGSWCGQLEPPSIESEGDPLWGIGETVKVKRLNSREGVVETNWGAVLRAQGAR